MYSWSSYVALVIYHDERTQYSLISGVISRYIRGSGQAILDKLTIAAKYTFNMHKSFSIILRFDI